jgi:uncharacterized protein YkwD
MFAKGRILTRNIGAFLAKFVSLIGFTLLVGCQTAQSPGAAAGASSSGAAYLASIRSSNGLSSLTADRQLEQAALQQAKYMAASGRMTHSTGWRRDFATRMKGNDINGAAAENLAHGRMEPARVFSMWMDSQGHRRNMLDDRFGRFGLAYAYESPGSDRRYWALVLAR